MEGKEHKKRERKKQTNYENERKKQTNKDK